MGDTFTVVRLRHPIDDSDPYALDGNAISIVRATDGLKLITKPASKPADPALKNALRRTRMQIGLRYPGD